MKRIDQMNAPAGIRRRHRNRADRKFYTLMMILPVAQILIFYFGVNFQSICMAFQKYDAKNNVFIWDTSKNLTLFKIDIQMAGFWNMIGNSLKVWVFTSLSGTVLAVTFAYYIYRRNLMSNFFKFVLFLPSVLPGILLAVMYKKFVGLGIPAFMNYLCDTTVSDVFNAGAAGGRVNLITLFTVWVSFGPQVLVYTGAMDRVDPAMLEAGRLDGASPLQEFFKIIFPNISSTVSTFLIIGVASIFTNQNNLVSFLGFDTTTAESTMGYYLYKKVYEDFQRKSGFCYAAFLGLICTMIVIPLAFGARKLFDRGDD
ncbi:MAG: sugar ABC transporter permease [Oscillospiraceae bacterium]|nr:sugar ABC transporter permease [Oscillospiraceae bacterium]